MLSAIVAAHLASLSFAPKLDPAMDDLSRRAVKFFWEQSEPTTGLTHDRGPNKKGGVQNNNDIASIAATGYALAAYAIGAKRGWLPKDQALKRARLTLDTFLTKVEGHEGWFYHFINWKTGKREWNSELSSIDSGLFFAGMIMADKGFNDPEYSRKCKQLMSKINWKFMLTNNGEKPDEAFICMGWKPEEQFINARWGGFEESPWLYIMAYGFYKDMPDASWNMYNRRVNKYKGLDLMWGGPLFMHQMPYGFYDTKNYRDKLGYDYFVEARNATLAQRLYAIENPQNFKGYSKDIWGLSACDIPDGYSAQGAPDAEDNGTLAPAAAAASLPFTPELSIQAVKAFKRLYPASYGQYGFTTGMNPSKDWYSPDVIGIDIGQMLLNIENYRDGLPHKWMMSRPETAHAYKRMGFHKTNEGPIEKRPLKR